MYSYVWILLGASYDKKTDIFCFVGVSTGNPKFTFIQLCAQYPWSQLFDFWHRMSDEFRFFLLLFFWIFFSLTTEWLRLCFSHWLLLLFMEVVVVACYDGRITPKKGCQTESEGRKYIHHFGDTIYFNCYDYDGCHCHFGTLEALQLRPTHCRTAIYSYLCISSVA